MFVLTRLGLSVAGIKPSFPCMVRLRRAYRLRHYSLISILLFYFLLWRCYSVSAHHPGLRKVGARSESQFKETRQDLQREAATTFVENDWYFSVQTR